MPSVKDLDVLLEQSEDIVTVAVMSEEKIDEMIKQRQESFDQFNISEINRESRIQKVDNYNPLKELKPSDYEQLVQEEMIDKEYADRLKKLDNIITKLESLDYPSVEVKTELEKLLEFRNTFREKLESQIQQKQEEVVVHQEDLKNRLFEHYAGRMEKFKRTIEEIESNPRVLERLRMMATKEMQEFEAKRNF